MPSSLGLRQVGDDLVALADVDADVAHAIGGAAKSAALDAAASDLGGDRSFSGMRRNVKLSAGYDTGDPVVLNLRPAGLWILADKGRRRSGDIRPRRQRRNSQRRPRGRAAVGTAGRFVKVGRFRPSRGLNTIDDAVDDISDAVPRAYLAHLDRKLAS